MVGKNERNGIEGRKEGRAKKEKWRETIKGTERRE